MSVAQSYSSPVCCLDGSELCLSCPKPCSVPISCLDGSELWLSFQQPMKTLSLIN